VELLDELLERDVLNAGVRLLLQDQVSDRADEVRLAEPRAAVDEQRVVREPGLLRHGARGRHRQTVGRPGDEVLEAVARIDVHSTAGDWGS